MEKAARGWWKGYLIQVHRFDCRGTLIAFTRQLTWSCKSPQLVQVTYGCYCSELTHKPPCYLSYHFSWLYRYAEQNMRDYQEELQSKTEELRSVLESSTIAENELREEAKLRKRYYLPTLTKKKSQCLDTFGPQYALKCPSY